MSNLQNFVTMPAISPYDNPFSDSVVEEFKRMLERRVDFAEVGVQPEGTYPVLLVGAVDVLSGEFRAFNSRRDRDRKSTRLNSSHANISYAVFCLKKKKYITPFYNFNSHYSSDRLLHP